MDDRIVIVGAGHAGGSVAHLLRQYGHTGPITIVGEEPHLPYQRPPLSKAWLKGEADGDSLALRPESFYGDHAIAVLRGAVALEIDRGERRVVVEGRAHLGYDRLVVATGASPIRLNIPGSDLDDVHMLRSAGDAERLKGAIGGGRRLAIIGGGYIGLEVAASSVALGGSAVVLEREERLLSRSGSAVIAEFFRAYHERRGVEVRLRANVCSIVSNGVRVTGVRLDDGTTIMCDAVLMGVGIVPNDALAQAAGLDCARGVLVDGQSRTSDPLVFAIGDCARRLIPLYDEMFCLESVPNALEQAKQAACAIMGRADPAPEVPWNWSDQYDLKLQIAGLPFGADHSVVRGEPESGRFAVFHLRGDVIRQVEAVNAGPEFMVGKQLIAKSSAVDVLKLARLDVSMRDVTAG